MERTRILVQPDGRAVVLRTPLGRSARFPSQAEAVRWHEGQWAATQPILVAALISVVADALLPTALFLPVLALAMVGGMVGTVWVSRGQRGPTPEWLTWEDSVALDERRHPLTRALKDLGTALASAALLAFFGYLAYDDRGRHLAEAGAMAQGFIALVAVGLVVGVAIGVGSAIQRLRFHLTRG